MTEEELMDEVQQYLDFLLLGLEYIDPRNTTEFFDAVNREVEEYERSLREKYSLTLKR